jgi:ribosomal protein L23
VATTLVRKGKMKRTRFANGKRPDHKHAIVTLAEGDSIEIFEAKGP